MDKQQRFARVILNGFYAYFAEFENITLAARTRFERAEWSSMQDISSRRIDIYKQTVMETLDVARLIAGDQIEDLTFWAETRSLYADLVQGMTNFEIAETFYNSIFNSHFGHRSIRNEYAFVFSPQGDVPPVDMGRVVNHYSVGEGFAQWRDAWGCAIPGVPVGDRSSHRLNDVGRRWQVDITEMEGIDGVALGLPVGGGGRDRECGLRAEVLESLREFSHSGHDRSKCDRRLRRCRADGSPQAIRPVEPLRPADVSRAKRLRSQ